MRKLLLKILPQFIIDHFKDNKKRTKSRLRDELKRENKILTKKDIEQFLQNNGIKTGDVIMLNSSLSKIGFVEGAAQSVIDGFLNVIGNTGTLVMPAFPAMGYNYDYLKTDPVFDVKNTSSRMGIITETFRKMKDVKRSLHPTDSVCALGEKADLITNSHYGQITPYNSKSPFYKLCELNAKIILLGVDFNSLTNLHTLEDAVTDFKFPVYHSHIFEIEIINEKNEKRRVKTKVHDPKFSKQRKCNELLPHFKKAGFIKETNLGMAHVMVIEAKPMHDWMVKNYNEKGITMYTPNGN